MFMSNHCHFCSYPHLYAESEACKQHSHVIQMFDKCPKDLKLQMEKSVYQRFCNNSAWSWPGEHLNLARCIKYDIPETQTRMHIFKLFSQRSSWYFHLNSHLLGSPNFSSCCFFVFCREDDRGTNYSGLSFKTSCTFLELVYQRCKQTLTVNKWNDHINDYLLAFCWFLLYKCDYL